MSSRPNGAPLDSSAAQPEGELKVDTAADDRRNRDQRALKSIAWSGAGKYAGQLFRWAATFFVARLLTPEDYGLVGMTAIFSGVVALLAEFGVSSAVIRMRDLDEDQLAQVNGLAVLLGTTAMLIGIGSAWPVSLFFGRQELVGIVAFSSIGFFVTAFQTVPSAVLQRATNFRRIAAIEFQSAILLAAMVLVLALIKADYWALVIPPVVVNTVVSQQYRRAARVRFAWPRLSYIQEAYRYSLWIISGRLSGYFVSNADAIIVGRLLGSSTLGTYSMAWDLANTPNDQINGLIARVSAPYYSELQSNKGETIRLFSLMLEGVACITFPLVLGLASVAHEFVGLVLGPKWVTAIPILQVLCVVAMFRVVTIMLIPLMTMVGEAPFQARVSFVSLLFVPPILYLAARRFGATGIALAWLACQPAVALAMLIRARTVFATGIGRILKALVPGTTSSLILVGTVMIVKTLLPVTLSPSVRLPVLILSGALSYAVVLFVVFGERISAFRTLVAGSFSKPAR